jgi:hypothetical protein
MEGM